jgi:DNA-binding transcriptional ArsR family regulator
LSRSTNSYDPIARRRELAHCFRALSDAQRLHILDLLIANGEMSVSAICEQLQQSQPAISHHLLQLRTAKLIAYRRDGKFHFYRIDLEGISKILDNFRGESPEWLLGPLKVQIDLAS